jgi:hypothetical protein
MLDLKKHNLEDAKYPHHVFGIWFQHGSVDEMERPSSPSMSYTDAVLRPGVPT